MEPKFKISEVFKTSWKAIKQNFWILIGLTVAYSIIVFIIYSLFGPSFSDTMKGIPQPIKDQLIYMALIMILGGLFGLGFIKNVFQALDGVEPQFSAYGIQAVKLLKYIACSIIFGIIGGIGLVLFIIPGIYFMLRFQFYIAFLVDENTGVIESLQKSWKITKGQTIKLLLLGIVQFLTIIAGYLILLIGVFVASPIVLGTYCETYRKLNPLKTEEEAIAE